MEPMVAIPSLTLPFTSVIQVTFLITLLVVIIFGVILYYHWEQYAVDTRVKNFTYAAYVLLTIPLIGVMGFLSLIL